MSAPTTKMHELCCDECGRTVAYTDDTAIKQIVDKSARLLCPPCTNKNSDETGEDE